MGEKIWETTRIALMGLQSNGSVKHERGSKHNVSIFRRTLDHWGNSSHCRARSAALQAVATRRAAIRRLDWRSSGKTQRRFSARDLTSDVPGDGFRNPHQRDDSVRVATFHGFPDHRRID